MFSLGCFVEKCVISLSELKEVYLLLVFIVLVFYYCLFLVSFLQASLDQP